MLSRLVCIALAVFPVFAFAQTENTVEKPVSERDENFPKLETTPIRPKQVTEDAPQFRIPEAQLERLRQESQKDPDLIIPLHIREPRNHSGKR